MVYHKSTIFIAGVAITIHVCQVGDESIQIHLSPLPRWPSMAESELLVAMVCGVLLTVVVEVFVVSSMDLLQTTCSMWPERGQYSPYVPAQSHAGQVYHNQIYDAMFYWMSDSFIWNNSQLSSICINTAAAYNRYIHCIMTYMQYCMYNTIIIMCIIIVW